MDTKVHELLDQIAAKKPDELTEEEKDFLRARRYYLTYEMQVRHKETLAGVSDVKPDEKFANKVPDKLQNTPVEEEIKTGRTLVNPLDPGVATDAKSVIKKKESSKKRK